MEEKKPNNEFNDLKAQIAELKEQLRKQEEKNALSLEAIRKEEELKKQLNDHELKFEKLESKYSIINSTIHFYGIFITVVITVLTFMGRDYLDDQINNYAQKRLDTVITHTLNSDAVKKQMMAIAEPKIRKWVENVQPKIDAMISQTLNSDSLKNQINEIARPAINKLMKEEIKPAAETELKNIKEEYEFKYDQAIASINKTTT